MLVRETTSTWTTSTNATWRSMNGSTANRLQVVAGEVGDGMQVYSALATIGGGTNNDAGSVGIAIGATNTNDADLVGRFLDSAAVHQGNMWARLQTTLPLGFQFYQATEYPSSAGTFTFGGSDTTAKDRLAGIGAEIEN